MNNSLIEKKIVEQLQQLEESQRLQVLDFVTFLVNKKPVGISGQNLLHFSVTISEEDLELMSQAIKEECDRIDWNEW